MAGDEPKLRVVETMQIAKFDGDAPKEGEHKEPIEVITTEVEHFLTKQEFEARYGNH